VGEVSRSVLSGPQRPASRARFRLCRFTRKGMNMKTTTILGIALIVLGVVAFVYEGISYTTRENVIDLGPLQATVDKKETIPLPPLVGGLAVVGGIALLIVGSRRA
jgi:hypothetical protein